MRSLPEPCWPNGHSLLRLTRARDAGKPRATSGARHVFVENPRASNACGCHPRALIRVRTGAGDRGELSGRCSELLQPLKSSCPQPPAAAVEMPTPKIIFPCLDTGQERQEFLLGASPEPLGDPSHVSFWLPPLRFSTSQRPDGVFAF